MNDDAPQADSIEYVVCEHGTLHFELRDKSGKPIARAALPAEIALDLTDFLVETYCPDDEDKIGEVAGHA